MFPVLSDDASSLMACNVPVSYEFSRWNSVYVWPRLNAAGDLENPTVLTGRRAVWGLNGMYVIVLSDLHDDDRYSVSVYKTEDLQPGSENHPWRQRQVCSQTYNFQAQMLHPLHPNGNPRVLICEIGKSESRRVTVWDLHNNEIVREDTVPLSRHRPLGHKKWLYGPRISSGPLSSVSSGCVWKST